MKKDDKKNDKDFMDMLGDTFFTIVEVTIVLMFSLVVAAVKSVAKKINSQDEDDGLSDESRKISRVHIRKGGLHD